MNMAAKLDRYLDEQSGIEQVQNFAITDKDKADWAVRKIAKHQADIEEAEQLAEQRMQLIQAWLNQEIKCSQAQIAFLESLLRPFIERELKGSKRKSIKLPSGTVGVRSSGARYYIDGEPVTGKSKKLAEWVKQNAPEYLVVKEEINWADFKKTLIPHGGQVITSDGEVIAGVVAEAQLDTLYVTGAV